VRRSSAARARGGNPCCTALDRRPARVYSPTRHPYWSARVSNVPEQLLYTADHEYVQATDDAAVVRIGITDYAQGELGDIVFVNLPKVGDTFTAHQSFGTIEAVKAVSELYAPLAGEVVEVNGALESDPAVVNRDPYGDGWMITLRLENPAELDDMLSASAYRGHIGE
jgi:glycine cleavage system H protein